MGLFDPHMDQIHAYLEQRSEQPDVSTVDLRQLSTAWPSGDRNNLVLSSDTAVELGSPKTASTSFLAWTDRDDRLSSGRLTLVGPDIKGENRELVPFGKAVLASVSGFDENNSYDRFREMEMVKYDIRLTGYMMRAVSQYQREWSRISKKAVADGFSLSFLGRALYEKLTALPYVNAVEIVFITASAEDVRRIQPIAEEVRTLTGAMNKMVEEMDFDCSSCDYRPVCDSVSELRAMKKAMQKQKKR